MKKALINEVTGQNKTYLAEFCWITAMRSEIDKDLK